MNTGQRCWQSKPPGSVGVKRGNNNAMPCGAEIWQRPAKVNTRGNLDANSIPDSENQTAGADFYDLPEVPSFWFRGRSYWRIPDAVLVLSKGLRLGVLAAALHNSLPGLWRFNDLERIAFIVRLP